MSKSLKNYVAAPEVIDKYGTDAARQWAAGGGATGSANPVSVTMNANKTVTANFAINQYTLATDTGDIDLFVNAFAPDAAGADAGFARGCC